MHLPVGTVSSSQHPLVSDDGATAPPTASRAGETKSHLVGELAGNGVLAVGDATGDGWGRDPVAGMHRGNIGQEPSGGGGQSQNQNYENLHADGCSNYK